MTAVATAAGYVLADAHANALADALLHGLGVLRGSEYIPIDRIYLTQPAPSAAPASSPPPSPP